MSKDELIVCATCGEGKSANKMHCRGLKSSPAICKKCYYVSPEFREYDKRYRAENQEKTREKTRRYQAKNPEKTKDSARRSREKNKERARDAFRFWRLNNLDRVRFNRRKWRANNPDRARELDRVWRCNNKEKVSQANRRSGSTHFRRAEKRGNYAERFNRVDVFRRDGWKCYYCNKNVSKHTAILEHKIPIAKGGSHTPANCTTSCFDCNASKGSKLIDGMQITIFDSVKV